MEYQQSYQLASIYGLLECVDARILGTSVDTIMMITRAAGGDEDYARPDVAAVEIKTRYATDKTLSAVHHLATIYETCATCSVGLDDPVVEFYTLITRMFERVQLLHHAATLGLNHVYYVEAIAIAII